jgi:hypothetical protein
MTNKIFFAFWASTGLLISLLDTHGASISGSVSYSGIQTGRLIIQSGAEQKDVAFSNGSFELGNTDGGWSGGGLGGSFSYTPAVAADEGYYGHANATISPYGCSMTSPLFTANHSDTRLITGLIARNADTYNNRFGYIQDSSGNSVTNMHFTAAYQEHRFPLSVFLGVARKLHATAQYSISIDSIKVAFYPIDAYTSPSFPYSYTINNVTVSSTPISAFLDTNGNNVQDSWEPSGQYATNPLTVNTDNTGINIVITEPAPSAPTGLIASQGSYTGRVDVSWSAVNAAAGYSVKRGITNNVNVAASITNVSGTSFIDISNIDGGARYYYWVQATNTGGASAFSSSANGYAVQLSPTECVASDGTSWRSVVVSWATITNVPNYEVWRGVASNSAAASKLATVGAVTCFADTNATPGVTYYYWIKAANVAMTSAFSLVDSGYITMPALSASSYSLTNTGFLGYMATSQSVNVWNSGGGECSFIVSNCTDWILSATPASGSFTGDQVRVNIDYQTAELLAGSYTGKVQITSPEATNSPVDISVYMTVIPAPGPLIGLSQTNYVTIATVTKSPASDVFSVWNAGLFTLNYSITSDVTWATIDRASGSSTGEYDVVNITYDTSSLPTGTYSGTITIISSDVANSPQIIGVHVIVGGLDIIVDNSDGASRYEESGTWYNSAVAGAYGGGSRYTLTPTATATWMPGIPSLGIYQVYAWWPAYSTRSTNVSYEVHHSYGVDTVTVNQRTNGAQWNLLGVYQFDAGTSEYVRVICPSVDQAGADAIKLSFFSDPGWDSSGNGMKDGDKIIAGISLTDPNDAFHIDGIGSLADSSDMVFSWKTTSGRVYSVEYSTNLTAGLWHGLVGYTNIVGTGSDLVITNTVHDLSDFYRLKVRLGP